MKLSETMLYLERAKSCARKAQATPDPDCKNIGRIWPVIGRPWLIQWLRKTPTERPFRNAGLNRHDKQFLIKFENFLILVQNFPYLENYASYSVAA